MMNTLLALLALWPTHGSTVSGHALYYGPGMFARVAHVRHMELRQDVFGYAAVPDCAYIGSVVEASIKGSAFERYQVLDCAEPWDFRMQVSTNRVIEVNYAAAEYYGFTRQGRAPATVIYP